LYCFLCAAHLEEGKTEKSAERQKHCNKVKKSVENDFIDYCVLQEIDGFDDEIMVL